MMQNRLLMSNNSYLIKFLLIFFITFSLNDNAISQNLLTNKKDLDYEIIDTVNIDGSLRDIRVVWLNDTIVINKRNDDYTIDTSEFQSQSFIEFMEASAQNCYSYALEKYFDNDSIYSQNLFNRNVTIVGPVIHTIIDNHFQLVHEFSVKETKKFMKHVPDNSIIGFLDKEGRIMHMVYFNGGVFFTKNGLFPATEFTNIRKLLKVFLSHNITQLRIYEFLEFNNTN